MEREDYIQLADSLDFLEDYHMEHAESEVSIWRGKRKEYGSADVYVTSDPEWKKKFAELTKDVKD